MRRKGQVSLYIVWFFLAVIVVLIAAFVVPTGILFNTKLIAAGDRILVNANDSINNISNAAIKASVQGNLNQAVAASDDNVDVLTDIYKYSWVVVLGLSAVVVFLFLRQQVAFGGGGIS